MSVLFVDGPVAPGAPIHGSSSSARPTSTISRSCVGSASSSSSRTSAPDSRRSPTESSASIACARVSASSERRHRRMTPPASGGRGRPMRRGPGPRRAVDVGPAPQRGSRVPKRAASRRATPLPAWGPASPAGRSAGPRARSSRPSVQVMIGLADVRPVAAERPPGRLPGRGRTHWTGRPRDLAA